MNSISDRIKEEARRLGFEKIGFARAEILAAEGPHLLQWLARGYQGTMSWMDRTKSKRVDPRQVYEGALSVVSVAMNYYTDAQHPEKGSGTGKISRYAWGDDYHEILSERLEQLLENIKRIAPGADGKVYVDTGPVMEKVWAQHAGIGWIGKHTNLITPDLGSWVFLGEILLNVELEYDQPATDHCGTCTLCIEACPTEAIVEPYVLDSTKCISYLTIEHRGPIPAELGEKFENWVFGCDICQDVCPWNLKFQTSGNIAGFDPRIGNVAPQLAELAEIGDNEFRDRYRNSPVKRAKADGLRRNAAVNLHQHQEVNKHGKKGIT